MKHSLSLLVIAAVCKATLVEDARYPAIEVMPSSRFDVYWNWVDYFRSLFPYWNTRQDTAIEMVETSGWSTLGWPDISFDERRGAELAREEEEAEDGFLITLANDDLTAINHHISSKDSEPSGPLRGVRTLGQNWMERMQPPAADYEEFLRIANQQVALEPRTPEVATIVKQVNKDITRPGVVGVEEGQRLAKDCIDVSLAYAIGYNPRMGFSQGMVDWCFFLKSVGQLDNESTFRIIIVMVEKISKLFNAESIDTDSFSRSFALVQVYSQIINFIKPAFGDLLPLLEAAALLAGQLPWELSANMLDYHFLSMGTRDRPLEDTVSVVDYILTRGRAGLVALFFANIELNYSGVMTLLASGDELAATTASRILYNPWPVLPLLDKAEEYMSIRVGRVSFAEAVEIMDIFVERNVRN